MLKSILKKLVESEDLTEEEAVFTIGCIMEGSTTEAQIGSFLTALRMKGESIEEITGCAKAMREKSTKIHPRIGFCLDTCGTGGDNTNTFNISTAAAFVAAAGGVAVSKHGNRAMSSKSGSADVLEALGVRIDMEPIKVRECIETIGLGFIFAQGFHKSMKYVAGPRRELGIRTIFNILGPLTNPAGAKGQLMGVFNKELTAKLAQVLLNLGLERAMVVHGWDGMDEITTTSVTYISELNDGRVTSYEILPEDYGIKRAKIEDLKGGDAIKNAQIIRSIFKGERSPKRDIVVLNAAAALYVGRAAEDMTQGVRMAESLIDSGRAEEKLDDLIKLTTNS